MVTNGHNSLELTGLEKRALFMSHYEKCLAAREVTNQAKAAEKAIRKKARGDGIVMRNIDFALRTVTIEDQDIIISELDDYVEIAGWFDLLPPGTQLGLFDEGEKSVDKAKREGASAGFRGGRREPENWRIESREGQAYVKAYDAAKAERDAALVSALQKKSAQRVRDAEEGNGADDDEGPEFDDK